MKKMILIVFVVCSGCASQNAPHVAGLQNVAETPINTPQMIQMITGTAHENN